MTVTRSVMLGGLLLGALSATAVAQNHGWYSRCSNRMLEGRYSFSCTGTALPSPDATKAVPIAMLGVVTADGKGHWSGPSTISIDGLILPQYVTTNGGARSVVNPDCTGTITYETWSGDPEKGDAVNMGPLPINFVVMDDGKRIRGLPTTKGSTIICELIRQ